MPLPHKFRSKRTKITGTSNRGALPNPMQATVTAFGRLELSNAFTGMLGKTVEGEEINTKFQYLEFYWEEHDHKLHIGFVSEAEVGFRKKLGESPTKIGLTISTVIRENNLQRPDWTEKYLFVLDPSNPLYEGYRVKDNQGKYLPPSLEVNEDERYIILKWDNKIPVTIKERDKKISKEKKEEKTNILAVKMS